MFWWGRNYIEMTEDELKTPRGLAADFRKILATKSFETELVLEYSSTPRPVDLGKFFNKMDLVDDDGRLYIQWNYGRKAPDEDETIIDIWADHNKKVTDYDGVFSLPVQAEELLVSAGFDVSMHSGFHDD